MSQYTFEGDLNVNGYIKRNGTPLLEPTKLYSHIITARSEWGGTSVYFTFNILDGYDSDYTLTKIIEDYEGKSFTCTGNVVSSTDGTRSGIMRFTVGSTQAWSGINSSNTEFPFWVQDLLSSTTEELGEAYINAPVQDVQVNGTSVVNNGIAEIPENEGLTVVELQSNTGTLTDEQYNILTGDHAVIKIGSMHYYYKTLDQGINGIYYTSTDVRRTNTSSVKSSVLIITNPSSANYKNYQTVASVTDLTYANPTLSGSETELTSLGIGNTKYKIASGGGSNIPVGITKGDKSLAIGLNSTAGSDDYSYSSALALGTNANATGIYAMALGPDAAATGGQGVALGISAECSGSQALALGPFARANSQDTVAIGQYSEANGTGAIAIGTWAKTKIPGTAAFYGYNVNKFFKDDTTLLIKDPSHIFFANEDSSSVTNEYTNLNQFANGKTLTQLLASAGKKVYLHEVWLRVPWETTYQSGAALRLFILSNKEDSFANSDIDIFYSVYAARENRIQKYNGYFYLYCGAKELSLAYTSSRDTEYYYFKSEEVFMNTTYAKIGIISSPGAPITITTHSKNTINLSTGEMVESAATHTFTVSSVSDNVTEL